MADTICRTTPGLNRRLAERHAARVASQPSAPRESSGATVVFLGLALEYVTDACEFQQRYQTLLEPMPTTILVASSGEADLLA